MVKKIKLGMLVGIVLIISACKDQNSSEDSAIIKDENWVNEEILIQLRDIRAELKALRTDVSAMKERLDDVQLADVRRTQPAGGAGVSSIPLAAARQLGDEDATVAVLEFTDFQCPYCKRHHEQTFGKIKANYVDTGKIRYLSMDFPLSFHSNAHSAAIAARCAGQQGKYWQMHDALFDNNRNLGAAFYQQAASQLGLEAGEFTACLKDKAVAQAVDQDMIAGSRYGVQGTPAFFLGRVEDGKLTDIVPMRGAQSWG